MCKDTTNAGLCNYFRCQIMPFVEWDCLDELFITFNTMPGEFNIKQAHDSHQLIDSKSTESKRKQISEILKILCVF